MKRPYLVTGGCGFVGRNLIKDLLANDSEVWTIDNLFTGKLPDRWLPNGYKKEKFAKGITLYKSKKSKLFFIKGDVIDVLTQEINGDRILPNVSDVFHLASIVGGREMIDNHPLLVSKDLAIDSYFFLWASQFSKKIQRILYTSSSAAYPITLQNHKKSLSLKESDLDFSSSLGIPDMTYGWGKLTGEYLSRIASKKYGMRVACVRPFSGYGEDQEEVYPIPAIAKRVALRENPLTVWGNGLQGRDFVHINDCISAFYLALDNISDGSAVNIASGKLTTFLEVLDIFSKLEGYSPKVEKKLDKPVGVKNRYGDPSKLKKMGWKQQITLQEGFRRVLEYTKEMRI